MTKLPSVSTLHAKFGGMCQAAVPKNPWMTFAEG